jgi:hypothetical protein
MSQEIMNKLDTLNDEFSNRVANLESELEALKVHPKDTTEQAQDSIYSLVKGDVMDLDSDLLRVDAAKKLVPADFGFDIEQLCYVRVTNASSTGVGRNSGGILTRSISSSSEYDPDGSGISLDAHGAFDYFNISEAQTADIDVAREIAKNFWTRYNNTVKDGMVEGDGTYFKGVKNFSTTTSWESNKIQTYTAYKAEVADVWASIIEALCALEEDGKKFVMVDPAVKAELVTTFKSDATSYMHLLKEMEPVIVQNSYLDNSCDTNDATVAIVGTVGRGYAVARGANLIATRNDVANKRQIYTGLNLGGGIVPGKGIAQVKTPTASASGS